METFGRVEIAVPRARLDTAEGKTAEWKSTGLRAYQRRTKQVNSLIAGAYLGGTNTRRVRRALPAVFGGAISKDTVSRVWRKVKGDWDAWNTRSLAEEPIIRLVLDGTVVRVRLTGRRPRSRSWSCSACVRTAKRCCWPSRTWVARPARRGAPCRLHVAFSAPLLCGGVLALNGADRLNGPRQWGSLLFCLVIVLSPQRAEGSNRRNRVVL